VSSHIDKAQIFCVRNGACVEVDEQCWSGDCEVANSILQLENGLPLRETGVDWISPEESRFSTMMLNLSLSEGVRIGASVGGLIVNQLSSPYGHCYQAHAGTVLLDEIVVPTGWTERQTADRASGMTTYGYSMVAPDVRGAASLGVFLAESGIGFLYSPLEWDEAKTMHRTTQREMFEAVCGCARRIEPPL
jgi:hypothetical protein